MIHHRYRRYGDEIVLAVPMKSVVYEKDTEEPRFEIREFKFVLNVSLLTPIPKPQKLIAALLHADVVSLKSLV